MIKLNKTRLKIYLNTQLMKRKKNIFKKDLDINKKWKSKKNYNKKVNKKKKLIMIKFYKKK